MELPEFWRDAVWHPLTVHWPIGMLMAATLFKLIAITTHRSLWSEGGSVLLVLGTLGSWVAIYTGNIADGAVSRTLCDPTVLKSHETAAETATWLFTAALVPDLWALWKGRVMPRAVRWLRAVTLAAVLVGAGFLIYAGHLGATLVYQQGAGVHHPSPDCDEFE